MSSLAALRLTFIHHLYALVGSVAMVLSVVTAWQIDRAAPFEYIRTEISPSPAVEGQTVTVTRYVIWHRQCDGQVFREVVKPSGQIAIYDRGYRPFPAMLGPQSAASSFVLPTVMLSPDMTRGVALYRGRVRFTNCGLTSRVWPIDIPFREEPFEIVRRL